MLTPRKQPRQNRSRETVDGILLAAADILVGRGLDALTTNAVAARAGVSIGSLYQYFPGKAALLAALIRLERATLLQAVELLMSDDRTATLQDFVSELVDIAITHHLQRPALSQALGLARLQLPPDPEAAEFTARIQVLLAARLQALGQTDADIAAQDLMAILRGMIEAESNLSQGNRAALAQRIARAARGYLQSA